jgi:class 3 adenylate cyclase
MQLYGIVPQVVGLLQWARRISYATLQQEFGLDVAQLETLRRELIFQGVAVDEQGVGLVWTGMLLQGFHRTTSPAHLSPLANETASNAERLATLPLLAVPPVPSTDGRAAATVNTDDGPVSPTSATPSPGLDDRQPAVQPERPEVAAAPISSTPEAERRQLTVLFCDLVGSTDLSGRLDPEDLREVVRAYQETAATVIHRYEGHIAQYLGDGLLVYFGYPQAHEDDAQRAVHTGLGIVAAMDTLNHQLQTDYGVQLAVRLGIHTGPVVGQMGGGGRHEHLALGDTPNLAARLEGLAPPNTIVISPVTARLVANTFALQTMGPQELKGVPDPMEVWRVCGLRDAYQERLEGTTPEDDTLLLVGRDEELGLLRWRWAQSQEGLGQVVLITGEAGIGKSSLVNVIRAQVAQEGRRRITFRCSQYHTNSALYPVITHLHQWLQFEREDAPDVKLAKLERGLEPYVLPVENVVPLVATLLSVPLPEDRYLALTLAPQQQR